MPATHRIKKAMDINIDLRGVEGYIFIIGDDPLVSRGGNGSPHQSQSLAQALSCLPVFAILPEKIRKLSALLRLAKMAAEIGQQPLRFSRRNGDSSAIGGKELKSAKQPQLQSAHLFTYARCKATPFHEIITQAPMRRSRLKHIKVYNKKQNLGRDGVVPKFLQILLSLAMGAEGYRLSLLRSEIADFPGAILHEY
jgi:hypothetical protein